MSEPLDTLGPDFTGSDWRRACMMQVDVVVAGSGAAGVAAAIAAREAGASVMLIEAEPHFGGNAILSGGNVALGGGTSLQKKYGISDSAAPLFQDLTDWALVEAKGAPDYRNNDREVVRAFADYSAETYEWLISQGVVFVDKAPDTLGGASIGNSAPREHHPVPMDWPWIHTGRASPQPFRSIGNVNFRRTADPRLAEEYCGLAGMPWSDKDASGEISAMAVGASLWDVANQAREFGLGIIDEYRCHRRRSKQAWLGIIRLLISEWTRISASPRRIIRF